MFHLDDGWRHRGRVHARRQAPSPKAASRTASSVPASRRTGTTVHRTRGAPGDLAGSHTRCASPAFIGWSAPDHERPKPRTTARSTTPASRTRRPRCPESESPADAGRFRARRAAASGEAPPAGRDRPPVFSSMPSQQELAVRRCSRDRDESRDRAFGDRPRAHPARFTSPTQRLIARDAHDVLSAKRCRDDGRHVKNADGVSRAAVRSGHAAGRTEPDDAGPEPVGFSLLSAHRTHERGASRPRRRSGSSRDAARSVTAPQASPSCSSSCRR